MSKIYIVLHIASGRDYPFSADVWATTNARQLETGVIEWQLVGEQPALAPPPVAKSAPIQTKKGGCGCNKKK
jgi:hypothetical protein